jgi:hypothetical protein
MTSIVYILLAVGLVFLRRHDPRGILLGGAHGTVPQILWLGLQFHFDDGEPVGTATDGLCDKQARPASEAGEFRVCGDSDDERDDNDNGNCSCRGAGETRTRRDRRVDARAVVLFYASAVFWLLVGTVFAMLASFK